MTLAAATLATPAGAFTVLFREDGLAASGFTHDPEDLRPLLPRGDRGARLRLVADAGAVGEALAAYLAGDLAAIDDVAVTAGGTAYQRRAWAALRAVTPGAPITYGELAARAGSPAAARAAGSACGRNPVALVVPCHRVVRGDGTLGGFAWGVAAKRWLLDHEARHAVTAPSPPPQPPAPGRTPRAGLRS